jgi:hypothetical protein
MAVLETRGADMSKTETETGKAEPWHAGLERSVLRRALYLVMAVAWFGAAAAATDYGSSASAQAALVGTVALAGLACSARR